MTHNAMETQWMTCLCFIVYHEFVWPYNKFEMSHDTVMNNIHGQLRGISTECPAPPTPEPDDEALWASDNSSDDLSSDGDSGSGGSE